MIYYYILMGSPQGGSNPLVSFLPIIAIFAIIYFLLIRPQRTEQKRQQDMIKSLRKGDEIVTVGGIYGKIVSLTEEKVTVKIAENTKIDVDRTKISAVRSKSESSASEEK